MKEESYFYTIAATVEWTQLSIRNNSSTTTGPDLRF